MTPVSQADTPTLVTTQRGAVVAWDSDRPPWVGAVVDTGLFLDEVAGLLGADGLPLAREWAEYVRRRLDAADQRPAVN